MFQVCKWKKLSVFVSSTFTDMHAERDHLMKVVFPDLQQRLNPHRYYLEPIDLRWGIDTESIADLNAKNLQILDVCAREIDRARPFQIVVFGERYGSIPPEPNLVAAARRAGLPDPDHGISVTEFEIEVGRNAPNANDQRCFVYARDKLPHAQMPPDRIAMYCGTADSADDRRLDALKARLRSADPSRYRSYSLNWNRSDERLTGLDAFGAIVLADLWNEFSEHIGQPSDIAPESAEQRQSWQLTDFINSQTRHFVGHRECLDRLRQFATSPQTQDQEWGRCITGGDGSGKSALLSQLAVELAACRCMLLVHSVEAVDYGGSVALLLHRWCQDLGEYLALPDPVPEDASPEQLDEIFAYRLDQAAQTTRVVILLDAIERLETTDRGRFMSWLPRRWPPNARLIAAGRPSDASWALESRAGCRLEPMPWLTPEEAAAIADAICELHHRTLNKRVRAALLTRAAPNGQPACQNPLWLYLVVEQINALDLDDFARAEQNASLPPEARLLVLLLQTADEAPAEIKEAYAWLLAKAVKRHGDIALTFAALLALAKGGWRTTDLLRLLERFLGNDHSTLELAGLRRTFRPHLIETSEGRLSFSHDQIRDAILGNLPTNMPLQHFHIGIADYLDTLPAEDPIRQAALMHHLLAAQEPARAVALLATTDEAQTYPAILAIAQVVVELRTGDAIKSWLGTLVRAGNLAAAQRKAALRRLQAQLPTELARAGAVRLQVATAATLTDCWRELATAEIADAGLQYEWARSLAELAKIQCTVGEADAAEASYQRACTILNKLLQRPAPKPLLGRSMSEAAAAPEPSVFEFKKWGDLASACYCGIGDLLAEQGRLDMQGAQGAYSQGAWIKYPSGIKERIADHFPLHAGTEAALLFMRLGYTWLLCGSGQDAYSQFGTALGRIAPVAELDPANQALRREVAVLLGRQSQALRWVEAPGAACLTAVDAVIRMEQLVQEDLSRRAWQVDLGYLMIWYGEALCDFGRRSDAHWYYRRAEHHIERVAGADPANKDWQSALEEVRARVADVNDATLPAAQPPLPAKEDWDYDQFREWKTVKSGDNAYRVRTASDAIERCAVLDPALATLRSKQAKQGPRFGDWQTTMGSIDFSVRAAIRNASDGVASARSFQDTLQKLKNDADSGVANAQCELGWAYWEGNAVPQDLALAITWLQKAAEQGMIVAQYDLGVLLSQAEGDLKNPAEAAVWWSKAADAGMAEAQYNLGDAYARGVGVPLDAEQAVAFTMKAARQGLAHAQYNMGVYYLSGFGVRRDVTQAVHWLELAAAQDLSEAEHNLGSIYLQGEGITRNIEKGLGSLRKAAERGLAVSQHDLAMYLSEGRHGLPRLSEALTWLQKSADQGYASSQYHLGIWYAKGLGVPKNEEAAAQLYYQAAVQGFSNAQHNLAWCYLQGTGVQRDLPTALDWMRKSAAQGNVASQHDLAMTLINDPSTASEGIGWLRRAAEHHPQSKAALALLLMNGQGVAKDEDGAIKLLQQALNQGFVPAAALLREIAARRKSS